MKPGNTADVSELKVGDLFRLADLYFNKKNYMYRHLYNSYDHMIEESVTRFLKTNHDAHVINEKITADRAYIHRFVYSNILIESPTHNNGIEPIFPAEARQRSLTYSAKIYADVRQEVEIIDIVNYHEGKSGIIRTVGEPILKTPVVHIPLMLRTKYCNLTKFKGVSKEECDYDPGGYFIVNGSEKIIISQDKMVENKPLVFTKKDSGLLTFVVQINSKSHEINGMNQIVQIKFRKDNVMMLKVPIFTTELNVFALFRALGFNTDRDIIDYCVYDINDKFAANIIRSSLEACKNDKDVKITTTEEAVDYLITKINIKSKRYSETDMVIRQEQKRLHLLTLLNKSFLPHIRGSFTDKGYFLGLMINRLVQVVLGRKDADDRDSYVNKRIDLPGDLMFDLFKQQYKKMMNDANKFFTSRNENDENPVNIIHQIKPNTIEQGLKNGLLTGAWIRRKGVAQMLQRLTYLQTIAFLRRVDSPSGDASSAKLTSPRQLHQSSVGFLCLTGDSYVQMAEGGRKQIRDLINGDRVISVYGDDLREEPTAIKHWFKVNNPSVLLRITLANGSVIKCTPDHRMMRGDNFNFRRADNFIPGETIVTRYMNGLITDDVLIYSEHDSDQNWIESFLDEYSIKYTRYNKFTHLHQAWDTLFLYSPTLTEYLRYAQKHSDKRMKYSTYISHYHISNDKFRTPIISIEEIGPEPVYDFETENSAHSFIVNGCVSSNCVVQTPEHANIGLTKHLNILASVTLMERDVYAIIYAYLKSHSDILDISEVPRERLRYLYKVILNGEWLGMVENGHKMYNTIHDKKLNGELGSYDVSVVWDIQEREIRINCDGGRMYRPIIRVEEGVSMLKKEYIDTISLNRLDSNMVTDWNEFLREYPRVIEYIDMEEQPYLMLAENKNTVDMMYNRMSTAHVTQVPKDNIIDDRYDKHFFLRYSHHEIHASLLLGEIATNVPFSNNNPGTRMIFEYAQGKQAMGIYTTTYRSRLDISYVLYHPQRPLVTTRTAKYINTEILPSGENIIVAIACYTGYNQEDSLVFNKTAVNRGMFRSTSLKKYVSAIEKDQSTARDDIFMKPDPNRTIGIKHGSYDKLNNQGFVIPETVINNNEIIIGKVTPLQNQTGSDAKQYRDSSEVYKSLAPGVIDRVYVGLQNQDGYETRKVLVRSEREPNIGDKFCITAAHEVLTDVGWVSVQNITVDHKVATLKSGKWLEYQNPSKIYHVNYDGKMYSLRSDQIDLDVTIDHRMWVRMQNELNYDGIPAVDIIDRDVYYKKDVCNDKEDVNTMIFAASDRNNELHVDMDTWLEFLGIFIADGWVDQKNIIYFAGAEVRKMEQISNVCNRLGLKYTKDDSDSYIKHEQIWHYLKKYNVSIMDRFLPDEVWNLSQRQARILLEVMISCDESSALQESVCYYRASAKLANDIMRLALHAGWSADLLDDKSKISDTLSVRINKIKNEALVIHTEGRIINDYKGMVYCLEVPNHVFYVRLNGLGVWTHNCSRHGQKGTIGILLDGRDMPFTEEGIRPDIIMNPNAIPSRMTVAQIVESLSGKMGANYGMEIDGTPFESPDINEIKERLGKIGYNKTGTEYMYNGMTGEKMKSEIFIGPVYYQRLKHLVKDKIHSRHRGPTTMLVRQPPEGRSRDGGLRLGVMEKDAIVAHGMAKFLKEKLVDNSDAYGTFVCNECGLFAQRANRRGNMVYATETDVYFCPACDNYNNVSLVVIPYAFKLLIQELMSMCVVTRLEIEK